MTIRKKEYDLDTKEMMRLLTQIRYKHDNWKKLGSDSYIRVASPRYAQTISIIGNYLESSKPLKILDLGAEESYMSLLIKYFYPTHSVFACNGIQFKEEVKRLLKQNNIRTYENVAFHGSKPLIFEENAFDTILLLEVFEHVIDNPWFVISELHRILKPGGFLFLTTPNIANLYNRFKLIFGKQPQFFLECGFRVGTFGHFREWTMNEIIDLLTRMDLFEIVKAKYIKTIGRYGRINRSSFLKLLYLPHSLTCSIKSSFRDTIIIVAKAKKLIN